MATNTAIVGLGVSTVDEILVLERFPLPNEKHKIVARVRQGGGLTGSALVAAARMGCACTHFITLGSGELSAFLRSELEKEGIRLEGSFAAPDSEPFYSIILSEQQSGERSILFDNEKALPPCIGERERERIRTAGCLFVDHVFAEAVLDPVREARRLGVPVVGDFERTAPGSLELMELADHLILPLGYARELLGHTISASEAAARLAEVPGRSVACVTDGILGAWYAQGERPDKVVHQPAFTMSNVVDTTGCGDVFHGVYAAGVVLGWTPSERILRASAAAALKTQRAGAQAGAPRLEELLAFLDDSVEKRNF